MRILENYPVNITEDSIASDTLPHSNPPLSFLDPLGASQELSRARSDVKDYYVHCPKLFKSASVKHQVFQTVHTEPSSGSIEAGAALYTATEPVPEYRHVLPFGRKAEEDVTMSEMSFEVNRLPEGCGAPLKRQVKHKDRCAWGEQAKVHRKH